MLEDLPQFFRHSLDLGEGFAFIRPPGKRVSQAPCPLLGRESCSIHDQGRMTVS